MKLLDFAIQAMNAVVPGGPDMVKAIYDQAKPLFDGSDQDTLKEAYDAAWAGAQQDHADLQREMRT